MTNLKLSAEPVHLTTADKAGRVRGWNTAEGTGYLLLSDFIFGIIPGGRLTLLSGVPVPSSDVAGATSIYYTPYLHNNIVLWDGSFWQAVTFTEKTLALGTVTSGLPYDVFGYLSTGTLALEKLAWTNGTTRAIGISLQDGRYCKTGDKTRLYLGTFYTTSTTQTEDSLTKRFLWNMYNRQPRKILKTDSTGWTTNTVVWRQARATTTNQIEIIVGLSETGIDIKSISDCVAGAGGFYAASVAINATNTTNADLYNLNFSTVRSAAFAIGIIIPSVGYNYIAMTEITSGASATITATTINGIIHN